MGGFGSRAGAMAVEISKNVYYTLYTVVREI
jgi:hypothetical protein